MKTRAIACIPVVAVMLVACDQVYVNARWDPPLAMLQDESAAGIYLGIFTDTSGAMPLALPVTAIIDPDGNTQILFAMAAERHVAGRVDVNGSHLTGTLTEFSGAFTSFTGASGVSAFTVRGNVGTGTSITGAYETEMHAGTFVLSYQASYEELSSLEKAAGIWSFNTVSSGGAVYTVTWDIGDDGLLFGADTLGCVFIGRVSVADRFVNAYRLAVQVDACGYFNGDYAGQAFLGSVADEEANWMTVGIANDVFAFATKLQRQSRP